MCLGDKTGAVNEIRNIEKIELHSSFAYWMEIELLGRQRRYKKQADLFQKYSHYEWASLACLQSLDHSGVNTFPLRKVFSNNTNLEKLSPLAELLKIKLDILDGDVINACTALDRGLKQTSKYTALYAYYRLSLLFVQDNFLESLTAGDISASNYQIDKVITDHWFYLALSLPQAWSSTPQRINHLINLAPADKRFVGVVASYALIYHWIMGEYQFAYQWVTKAPDFHTLPESKRDVNQQTYFLYVLRLCAFWQNNQILYDCKAFNYLEVLGESHSLSPCNSCFTWRGRTVQAKTNFVMGIKMWHFLTKETNFWRYSFEERLSVIKPGSSLLITIGEIDCRPNEGIWVAAKKLKKPVDHIVSETVDGYLAALEVLLKSKQFVEITIQGVPAPAYPLIGARDPGDKDGFLKMIKHVNQFLKEGALKRNWFFLDVYAATVNEEGTSNRLWHIDGHHLKPSFYQTADSWFVMPI